MFRANKKLSVCKKCLSKKMSIIKKGCLSWNKGLSKKDNPTLARPNNGKNFLVNGRTWHKGKTNVYTKNTLEKIGNAKKGKTYEELYGKDKSNLLKNKMSEFMLNNNPTKRKDVRDKLKKIGSSKRLEVRKKIRLSIIKHIEINKNNGNQLMPFYNKNSIPILEQKAKELKIKDLQHAENGGEFYISELGYWVDGYSKEKNIVIEFYETRTHKNKQEKDNKRKKEIIDFLKCKFIEIKEWEN